MTHGHNQVIIHTAGRHHQSLRRMIHHQRMIPSHCIGRGDMGKQRTVCMTDLRLFAVHGFGGANNVGPKGLPQSLMAQTHPQKGNVVFSGITHQRNADAGVFGGTGTWGNNNGFGGQGPNIRQRDGIIAHNMDARADHLNIMDQIINKTVVIINKQNHGKAPCGNNAPRLSQKVLIRRTTFPCPRRCLDCKGYIQ